MATLSLPVESTIRTGWSLSGLVPSRLHDPTRRAGDDASLWTRPPGCQPRSGSGLLLELHGERCRQRSRCTSTLARPRSCETEHLADRGVLQAHPMGDEQIPLTGVFRTRSPDRPNPIGVHRVTLTAREGATTLRVEALEAIDGTPIIDLKIAMRESQDA